MAAHQELLAYPGRATRTATLLTRRVENYIEVGLDIPEIRLRPYEVGRSNLIEP